MHETATAATHTDTVFQVSPTSKSQLQVIYESRDNGGWTVLLLNDGSDSVAVHRGKPARLIRDRVYEPGDYFVLPPELAGPVLATARELEAQREAAVIRGYEAMAADEEREKEAFEWSEALIGDGLEAG